MRFEPPSQIKGELVVGIQTALKLFAGVCSTQTHPTSVGGLEYVPVSVNLRFPLDQIENSGVAEVMSADARAPLRIMSELLFATALIIEPSEAVAQVPSRVTNQ